VNGTPAVIVREGSTFGALVETSVMLGSQLVFRLTLGETVDRVFSPPSLAVLSVVVIDSSGELAGFIDTEEGQLEAVQGFLADYYSGTDGLVVREFSAVESRHASAFEYRATAGPNLAPSIVPSSGLSESSPPVDLLVASRLTPQPVRLTARGLVELVEEITGLLTSPQRWTLAVHQREQTATFWCCLDVGPLSPPNLSTLAASLPDAWLWTVALE